MQEADADGNVTFTSIFPAAYSGRWPHIHFEVYPSVADATSGGNVAARPRRSRCPRTRATTVYATAGYEQSVQNMTQTTLANDNVFSDGWDQELGTVTGDVTSGLTVTLADPVGSCSSGSRVSAWLCGSSAGSDRLVSIAPAMTITMPAIAIGWSSSSRNGDAEDESRRSA